ncbi:DoxX family protein [Sphingobium sp. AN558]|uniref:DoxX family protein n=1 Tax=Sphingobium sp. AN558 TaxID=3133442 RepID=UPI0030C06F3A
MSTLPESRPRKVARGLLAAAFAIAGVAHLTRPGGFVAITPHWVPAPETVVALTGGAELAGAAGLLIPRLRTAAGIGLALYALCVWPANINHALADIPLGGTHLSWWYHGPRLALQPVIIWWALWASGATNWPMTRKR